MNLTVTDTKFLMPDVPQRIINVVNCIDYLQNDPNLIKFWVGEFEKQLRSGTDYPLKKEWEQILSGQVGDLPSGKQKVTKDVPQEFLNVLNCIEWTLFDDESIKDLEQSLTAYIVTGKFFVLKDGYNRYLSVT